MERGSHVFPALISSLGTVKCELMHGQDKSGSSGICYAVNSHGFGKMDLSEVPAR